MNSIFTDATVLILIPPGVNDILDLSHSILKEGVGYIFPTLVTDSVENIERQIQVIKNAAGKQTPDMAKICGVHLEGIFLKSREKRDS